MKYIRTKDGIYELESTYEHRGKTYYGIRERISTFAEEEIVKQADTIEELCDEFVRIVISGRKSLVKDYEIAKEEKLKHKDKLTYYGAIWTDKGLIYVAKMNEKGELELL